MRSIVIKFTALLALVGWCYIASAQETNISVGAVTKFSGITTGQGDIKDLKDLNEFLNVLESQLAKEFEDIVLFLQKQNSETIIRQYIEKSRHQGLNEGEKMRLQICKTQQAASS